MFDDHVVNEKAHQDIVVILRSSLRELTHDFGEKSEIFLFVCLFFNKISLKIMPHDHLVRKQALKYYKKWILHSSNIGIFSERFTHYFGQKMKIIFIPVRFWTK